MTSATLQSSGFVRSSVSAATLQEAHYYASAFGGSAQIVYNSRENRYDIFVR